MKLYVATLGIRFKADNYDDAYEITAGKAVDILQEIPNVEASWNESAPLVEAE